jgi:outer membrane lipoprotein-sorting protein
MLTSAVLAAVMLARQEPQSPSAAQLISKVLARYANAQTLEGTVTLTQTARGFAVKTVTQLAYERPSKILLVQRQGGSQPKASQLVSNGEKFVYTRPDQLITQNDYLGELVKPDERRPAQTVGDLYAIIASGLPDRAPLLDLLVARHDDMVFVSKQFRTLSYAGRVQFGDRSVQVVKGNWKENEAVEGGVGEYELYITDEGDLVRYVLKQKYAVPGSVLNGRPIPAGDPIEVVSTWDASVTVNGPIKPETFALRAH